MAARSDRARDRARRSPRVSRRLARSFYDRPTEEVAVELIGKILVHDSADGRTSGRIVETEAYLGDRDAASHSFRGKTARNAAMFGPAGRSYVYFVYGVHYCFNVVTRGAGVGEAVLVRALEPLEGLELMRARRGSRVQDRDLCNGPGKLAQAMGFTRAENEVDLVRGAIGVYAPHERGDKHVIVTSTRVGITRSAELPLRFHVRDHPHVSRK